MRALMWSRLTDIARTQKPYRGTTNRYPVADRRHNTKCFYIEERDGETVYKITYGYTFKENFHTKEEFEKNNKIKFRDWEKDLSKAYVSYTHIPRELGVVRSDNTFEFTGGHYGQGDNSIMSSWNGGWFYQSSRHGGMVYKEGHGKNTNTFHPIFKGMRIKLDDMSVHESSKYQVIGKRVSRSDAKEFLSGYQDFYKINEAMFKVMDWKGLMDTGVDIANIGGLNLEDWYCGKDKKANLLKFAKDNIINAPLDACVAYLIGYDIKEMYRRVRAYSKGENNYYTNELDIEYLFDNVKRKLNKELYRSNPTVMKDVKHEMGKPYPSSEWGITILVNGQEVEQYC